MHTLLQRVRRAPAWLRDRALKPATILCYHRVTVLERDPHLLTISPAQFEEHLQAIRESGTPTALRDLSHALRTGRPIRDAIVVTFDDGYADNLYEAAPLLERYAVPATVFVATGQIDATAEYWWDALERLLLGAHPLPDTLPLAAEEMPLDVPPLAQLAAAEVTRSDDVQHWRQQREHLMHTVRNALLEMPPTAIPDIVSGLHDATRVSREPRASHRCCSADELRELARSGLVEIGAHTISHPRLAQLDLDAQTRELATSRETLEAVLGRPVTAVAYPFGRSSDINADTMIAARRAGFDVGCTLGAESIPTASMFRNDVDPLRLPRHAIHPIDGAGLAARLREFMRT
ncbi:MAG TPA: polysaccharide deacetylase family protein [Gemmatimonadaceae bacterium]|nr:polysaccharide deacetylase family protein [Gemmatimonadaceae bacterium]